MPKLSDARTSYYKETVEIYTYDSPREWADHIAEMTDKGYEFLKSDNREKWGYHCIFKKTEEGKEN